MRRAARLLLSVGVVCAIATECAFAQLVNRIVAVVNDDVITEGDVAIHVKALQAQESEQSSPIPPEQEPQMRRALLQRLIEQRLILQEAKRLEISVSAEDVLQRLQQLRQRLGTDEAYAQLLQEAHMNEEQLKSQLRDQLLIQKTVDQEVRAKIVVTLSDVAHASPEGVPASTASTEEARVQHLLLRVSDSRTAEQAEALANDLHEQLARGAEFASLARRYSDDPNAQEGGEMGWVRRGQLLPELDEAIFALSAGQASTPIRSRLGYHLVNVLERRTVSPDEHVKAQDVAQATVYQHRFEHAMREWLDRLTARAYIDIPGE